MSLVTEDIAQIALDVWSGMLALDAVVSPGIVQPDDANVTGSIHVTGPNDHLVSLETTLGGARTFAAAMFGMPEDEVSEEEVSDAVGELTNMVGGNIKGLLPQPSQLSLPVVASGHVQALRVPGAEALHQVCLVSVGAPVLITVWSRPTESTPITATQESALP
jgi:chemotaxis protein CheX